MSATPKPRKIIPIEPQPQSMYKSEPKVYPRSITGLFQNWRWIMAWLTQIVFYGLCWLPWNGRQAVLFDLDRRRFFIFDFVELMTGESESAARRKPFSGESIAGNRASRWV